MQRAHVRRSVVVATLAAAVLLLTGCTSSGSLPKDYGHAWIDRMQNALHDDHGSGGLGMALVISGHRAVGSFGTDTEPGTYDVLTVCRSTAIVHVTVRNALSHGVHRGSDTEGPGPVVDEGDVVCGATTRLSIDVGENDGIVIDAETKDVSGRALWSVQVVRSGWEE